MPTQCLARYHIINYNPIKKKIKSPLHLFKTSSMSQDQNFDHIPHYLTSSVIVPEKIVTWACIKQRERERDEPWIVGLLRGRSTGNFSDDRSNKKAAALFFKALLLFLLLFFLEPPDLNPAQFSGRETHAPISLFRLLNTPSPEIEIQDKYCVFFLSLCLQE